MRFSKMLIPHKEAPSDAHSNLPHSSRTGFNTILMGGIGS